MVGVGVFFIICHSFYYLLYRVRLICIRTVKTNQNSANKNRENCFSSGIVVSDGTGKEDLEC